MKTVLADKSGVKMLQDCNDTLFPVLFILFIYVISSYD